MLVGRLGLSSHCHPQASPRSNHQVLTASAACPPGMSAAGSLQAGRASSYSTLPRSSPRLSIGPSSSPRASAGEQTPRMPLPPARPVMPRPSIEGLASAKLLPETAQDFSIRSMGAFPTADKLKNAEGSGSSELRRAPWSSKTTPMRMQSASVLSSSANVPAAKAELRPALGEIGNVIRTKSADRAFDKPDRIDHSPSVRTLADLASAAPASEAASRSIPRLASAADIKENVSNLNRITSAPMVKPSAAWDQIVDNIAARPPPSINRNPEIKSYNTCNIAKNLARQESGQITAKPERKIEGALDRIKQTVLASAGEASPSKADVTHAKPLPAPVELPRQLEEKSQRCSLGEQTRSLSSLQVSREHGEPSAKETIAPPTLKNSLPERPPIVLHEGRRPVDSPLQSRRSPPPSHRPPLMDRGKMPEHAATASKPPCAHAVHEAPLGAKFSHGRASADLVEYSGLAAPASGSSSSETAPEKTTAAVAEASANASAQPEVQEPTRNVLFELAASTPASSLIAESKGPPGPAIAFQELLTNLHSMPECIDVPQSSSTICDVPAARPESTASDIKLPIASKKDIADTPIEVPKWAWNAGAQEADPATPSEKPHVAAGDLTPHSTSTPSTAKGKGRGKGMPPGPPPRPASRASNPEMSTTLPENKRWNSKLRPSFICSDSPTAFNCHGIEFPESMWAVSHPEPEQSTASSTASSKAHRNSGVVTVSVLEMKRSIFMELTFSKLSVSAAALAEALKCLNTKGLTVEDITCAMGKMPTHREAEKLLEHSRKGLTLSKFEQTLVPLCHVPDANARLELMQCAMTHGTEFNQLLSQLQCVKRGAAEARASVQLSLVLRTSLDIFNIINYGSKSGGAASFPISSFSEFAQHKHNGQSPLIGLCQILKATDPEFFSKLTQELNHIDDASLVNWKDVLANVKNFNGLASTVSEHLRKEANLEAKIKANELLEALISESAHLRTAQQTAEEHLREAQLFFGERGNTTLPSEEFFSHITQMLDYLHDHVPEGEVPALPGARPHADNAHREDSVAAVVKHVDDAESVAETHHPTTTPTSSTNGSLDRSQGSRCFSRDASRGPSLAPNDNLDAEHEAWKKRFSVSILGDGSSVRSVVGLLNHATQPGAQ